MAISSKTSASLSGGISQLLSQSHAPFPRETGAAAAELCRERDGREKKSEEEVGQLSALRRYDLVPPPFFAARGFVSAPLTLSSATFATSVLAIAVVFLAALPASVTPRRRPRPRKKKSETASSVTPAQNISKTFGNSQD